MWVNKCGRARILKVLKFCLLISVMDGLDFEVFGDYLLEKGLHEDVVATIISNRICSETFLRAI